MSNSKAPEGPWTLDESLQGPEGTWTLYEKLQGPWDIRKLADDSALCNNGEDCHIGTGQLESLLQTLRTMDLGK